MGESGAETKWVEQKRRGTFHTEFTEGRTQRRETQEHSQE
jgi:hypothetical protein